jgi:hypothetical protein
VARRRRSPTNKTRPWGIRREFGAESTVSEGTAFRTSSGTDRLRDWTASSSAGEIADLERRLARVEKLLAKAENDEMPDEDLEDTGPMQPTPSHARQEPEPSRLCGLVHCLHPNELWLETP